MGELSDDNIVMPNSEEEIITGDVLEMGLERCKEFLTGAWRNLDIQDFKMENLR